MYADKVKQQKRENEGTLVVLGFMINSFLLMVTHAFLKVLFVGVSIQ
jgi:hypothetical protein